MKGEKKRVAKICPSKPPQALKKRRVNKMARRPRTSTLADNDDSYSNIVSEVLVQGSRQKEQEDTAASSQAQMSQSISTTLR